MPNMVPNCSGDFSYGETSEEHLNKQESHGNIRRKKYAALY